MHDFKRGDKRHSRHGGSRMLLERRWFQVSRFACEPESVISSTKSTFGDPCGVYHRLSDENLKALAILNSRRARYKRPDLAISSHSRIDAMPLTDKRFLMFVDDVYEDLELWYPKLRLIEAGGHVTVAGPKEGHLYRGKHGYPCTADAAIADMHARRFSRRRDSRRLHARQTPPRPEGAQLVREFAAAGKLVAAICHGGWIPISAGVYRGVRVTGSPGIKDDLINAGAVWEDAPVVDRSPLRLQPQARRPTQLLPRDFASDDGQIAATPVTGRAKSRCSASATARLVPCGCVTDWLQPALTRLSATTGACPRRAITDGLQPGSSGWSAD